MGGCQGGSKTTGHLRQWARSPRVDTLRIRAATQHHPGRTGSDCSALGDWVEKPVRILGSTWRCCAPERKTSRGRSPRPPFRRAPTGSPLEPVATATPSGRRRNGLQGWMEWTAWEGPPTRVWGSKQVWSLDPIRPDQRGLGTNPALERSERSLWVSPPW